MNELAADAIHAIDRLLAPYFDAHPECEINGHVIKYLTPDEQDEYRSLARLSVQLGAYENDDDIDEWEDELDDSAS